MKVSLNILLAGNLRPSDQFKIKYLNRKPILMGEGFRRSGWSSPPCLCLLWLLRRLFVLHQQNEGFWGLGTAPSANIICSTPILLQRLFVSPQQNEGFRALGTAQRLIVSLQQNKGFRGLGTVPSAIIIASLLIPLQRLFVSPTQNEGFRGLGTAQRLIVSLQQNKGCQGLDTD